MDKKSRVGKHAAGRESVPVVDDKRHGVVSLIKKANSLHGQNGILSFLGETLRLEADYNKV